MPKLNERDQEEVDRFAAFLQVINDGPRDDVGRVGVTEETFGYLLGEGVAPHPVDQDHPAVSWWRQPKKGRSHAE